MSTTGSSRRNAVGLATALVVSLCAWGFIVSGPDLLPNGMALALIGAARSLTAGLFLVAGTARLAGWRLTGDNETGYSAIALLVVGTAIPAAGVVDAQLKLTSLATPEALPARLTLLLPAFGVIAVGALSHRRLTPRRFAYLLTGFVTVTLAVAAIVVVLLGQPARSAQLNDVWISLEIASAVAWVVVAVHVWRHAEQLSHVSLLVLATGLMAVCELLKAWAAAVPGAPRGIATGVQLAAAAIVVLTSVSELVSVARSENRRSIAALREAQQRLIRVEQRERARLHDARSVVLGVRGASALLVEPSPGVDRTRLRQMVNAELERLRDVLDEGAAEPISDFRLVDALGPVLLAHRLNRMTVEAHLGGIHVLGRPHALATVVDNVLTNAQVHAPDARVAVVAAAAGTRVVLTIEDDGPGIPHSERARVLAAGIRGSSAAGPGSGLGLYSAASAMAEQDGTLRISGRSGGGTRIVITMPRGAPPAHSPAPAMAS